MGEFYHRNQKYNEVLDVSSFFGDGIFCRHIAFPALAQTATDTFGVSLTVEAECTLSAEDLAFGATGIVDACSTTVGALTRALTA